MLLLFTMFTIVAIGHGLLKKFWPMVIGYVLRTAGSSIIWNYADPLTSLELLNYYLTLVISSGISVIQRNDTINDNIFHKSDGRERSDVWLNTVNTVNWLLSQHSQYIGISFFQRSSFYIFKSKGKSKLLINRPTDDQTIKQKTIMVTLWEWDKKKQVQKSCAPKT